jgi:hypothetical protein
MSAYRSDLDGKNDICLTHFKNSRLQEFLEQTMVEHFDYIPTGPTTSLFGEQMVSPSFYFMKFILGYVEIGRT